MEETDKLVMLELQAKKLDVKRKKLELKEVQKEFERAELRTVLDKVSQLRSLMTERVVDDEKTIFASETRWKNILDDSEMQVVKNKILSLVKKF